ncbi:unnamed protein product [Leuciscus chuanchicus]
MEANGEHCPQDKHIPPTMSPAYSQDLIHRPHHQRRSLKAGKIQQPSIYSQYYIAFKSQSRKDDSGYPGIFYECNNIAFPRVAMHWRPRVPSVAGADPTPLVAEPSSTISTTSYSETKLKCWQRTGNGGETLSLDVLNSTGGSTRKLCSVCDLESAVALKPNCTRKLCSVCDLESAVALKPNCTRKLCSVCDLESAVALKPNCTRKLCSVCDLESAAALKSNCMV